MYPLAETVPLLPRRHPTPRTAAVMLRYLPGSEMDGMTSSQNFSLFSHLRNLLAMSAFKKKPFLSQWPTSTRTD